MYCMVVRGRSVVESVLGKRGGRSFVVFSFFCRSGVHFRNVPVLPHKLYLSLLERKERSLTTIRFPSLLFFRHGRAELHWRLLQGGNVGGAAQRRRDGMVNQSSTHWISPQFIFFN